MADDLLSPGSLALPHIQTMQGYIPGDQPDTRDWVKLNTNENPFPPSPRVEEAIRKAAADLTRYPNPTSCASRAALARQFKLQAECVLVGNGSDDVLNLLFRAFAGPDQSTAAIEPSYSLYPILASIQNAPFERIPLADDLSLPIESIGQSKARLFFLTSPNAPLGVGFPNASIEETLEAFPGILVVDEAYAAFAQESAVPLVRKHPRLVVTRSFSKSHGLAGLRIGFLLGHPEVIEQLDKVRESYNVDSLAQAGLQGALQDPDYFRATIGKIRNIRNYYQQWFENLGWYTFPSQANFLTTRPQSRDGKFSEAIARDCFEFLKQQKILVRFFPNTPRIADCLRISIGSEDQMEILEKALLNWREQT